MTLGQDFSALATAQITNGELWTHEITLSYAERFTQKDDFSEATSDGTPPALIGVKVAAFGREAFAEGNVRRSFWQITVPAEVLSTPPTTNDMVTIEGVEQTIIDVKPLGASGEVAAYVLEAER